jgi:hypothetical protein
MDLALPAVASTPARMSEPALGELRDLTDALLEHAARRITTATKLELHARARSNAVRLEVRWSDGVPGRAPAPDGDRVRPEPAGSSLRRLADRCGMSDRAGRHLMWAEKRISIPERRSA